VDIELASPTRPVPDYGGTVVLINVQPWLIASGTFTGYRVGDRYHEREVFTDVDAAIDWSREVADTVVVSLGSSRSEVFSAGSADPVGRPLPRLRARDNSICTWEGNAAAASIKLGLDELNAVVDELLTRQEFSGVAVTAREQTEERVSLSFRVRSARYGEAHALAETFSTTLAGEVARREQPHKKPLVFAVLGKRPAVKLIDA
jgi:hypothetical protein